MTDWLTIELVLGVLLVTTFASVGLLALWAATSPRHWFIRVAVVLVILLPLLVIPAYELFLAIVLAIGMVCSLTTAQQISERKDGTERGWRRFARFFPQQYSLKSALLLVALAAAILVIAMRIPRDTWASASVWATSGALTGAAIWKLMLAAERRSALWKRLVAFAGALVFLASCFIICGTTYYVVFIELGFSSTRSQVSLWWFASAASVAAILHLYNAFLLDRVRTGGVNSRRHVTLIFLAMLFISAMIPLIVVWELLNPLPIPSEPSLGVNNYARLVEIGERFGRSPIETLYDADPIDYDKLASAVAARSADYDELTIALTLPSWIPTHYDNRYVIDDSLSARRRLTRALAIKGIVEQHAGNSDLALNSNLKLLDLALVLHQGGVAIDFLIAIAAEQIAIKQLYGLRETLDASQLEHAIDALNDFQKQHRDLAGALHRERVWSQRALGWVGHLAEIIGRFDSAPSPGEWWYGTVPEADRRANALTRLLTADLAIRAYHDRNQQLPTGLEELVPQYLKEIPPDPFTMNSDPLRYIPSAEGYLLYSVGVDGDDDGGEAPLPIVETGAIPWDGDGDLRLDVYLARQEEPSAPPGPGESGATDVETDLFGEPLEN